MRTPVEALRVVVDEAGGQAPLARRINQEKPDLSVPITQSHVWGWLFRPNCVVPPELCTALVKISKRKVTKHELRPDVFEDYTKTRKLKVG